MGRVENIIVFKDTVERRKDNQRLTESIKESCDSQVLVLGAFGCGAFVNAPRVVALMMVWLAREYASCFHAIEFAVYCSRWERENYHAFQQALEG